MITKNKLRRLGRYAILAAYLGVFALWSASALANNVWIVDYQSNKMIEVSKIGKILSSFIPHSDRGSITPNIIARGNHSSFWVNDYSQPLFDHFYHYGRTGKLLGAYHVHNDSEVTSIAIDHAGSIWVAAKRFTEFDPFMGTPVGHLGSNFISVYSPDGKLVRIMPMDHSKPCQIVSGTVRFKWIAASDGIYQASMDGSLKKVASEYSCPVMAGMPDGSIWAATTNGQSIRLTEYDRSGRKVAGFVKNLTQSVGLFGSIPLDGLAVTATGIWVATNNTLYNFNATGKINKSIKLNQGVVGMVVGANESLWLAGLSSIDNARSWISVVDRNGNVITQKNLLGIRVLAIGK